MKVELNLIFNKDGTRNFLLKFCLLLVSIFSVFFVNAQVVEKVFRSNIQTPQLYMKGDQTTLPFYQINSNDQLELEFDDLDANYKNYYYTWQLCDYDWKPSNLNFFDYMKGFTQTRINTYRYSSVAYTRYTHYQAFLPDDNARPVRSGNYLLKVYLDGDTTKLAFTKQVLVFEPGAAISAEVVQSFTPELFKTHQRIRFNAGVKIGRAHV